MSERNTTEHLVRRLTVALPTTYDKARADFERIIPALDRSAFAAAGSWRAQVQLAREVAPLGFMRFGSIDVGDFMAGSDSRGVATEYLMGNHTIAETMFRHNPAVMLHAPLRVLIYVGHDDSTYLATDQPSLLFDSYGDERVSAVGHRLDAMVSEVITLLGGDVPEALAVSAHAIAQPTP